MLIKERNRYGHYKYKSDHEVGFVRYDNTKFIHIRLLDQVRCNGLHLHDEFILASKCIFIEL